MEVLHLSQDLENQISPLWAYHFSLRKGMMMGVEHSLYLKDTWEDNNLNFSFIMNI